MEALKLALILVSFVLIIFVLGTVYFIFWIFMLIDCINRRFDKKLKWLLILNLVPFGSVFYYFIIKKKDVKNKKDLKHKEFETLAVISFIMGVVSIKMFIYFGLALGALSVVFGVIAKKRIRKNPKLNGMELAKAGIILSIVAAILQVLVIILYISFIGLIFLTGQHINSNELQNKDKFLIDYPTAIHDTLFLESTKTYTLDRIDYEITAKNITTSYAIFKINGFETTKIRKDQNYVLPGGAVLKVYSLRLYEGLPSVNFFLVRKK